MADRGAKLTLKLRNGLPGPQLERVLRQAREAGASVVRPVFPDHSDAELASLYAIEARDVAAVDSLIETLEGLADVEFVEREVQRGLKR